MIIRIKFNNDDHQNGDWKAEEIGTFLSMTYQDVGPVVWIIKDDGSIVGANPKQVKAI